MNPWVWLSPNGWEETGWRHVEWLAGRRPISSMQLGSGAPKRTTSSTPCGHVVAWRNHERRRPREHFQWIHREKKFGERYWTSIHIDRTSIFLGSSNVRNKSSVWQTKYSFDDIMETEPFLFSVLYLPDTNWAEINFFGENREIRVTSSKTLILACSWLRHPKHIVRLYEEAPKN